jgi:hypothetical protein
MKMPRNRHRQAELRDEVNSHLLMRLIDFGFQFGVAESITDDKTVSTLVRCVGHFEQCQAGIGDVLRMLAIPLEVADVV